MKVCRVEEMREMDRRAVEEFGIPDLILMENAGNASFFVIEQNMRVEDRRFVVFCGGGNNGGDGLVVARKLHANGAAVKVYLLSDPARFKNSAQTNYQTARKLGLDIQRLENVGEARETVMEADALVDAIFGTGLTRNVEGLYYDAIQLINDANKPVFSIDIPSGINGNTGQVMGIAVKAAFTTTYGQPKAGNLLYPGYGYAGRLSVTHISFPPQLHNDSSILVEVNDVLPLAARPAHGHKGSFGKALFIAGSSQYLGAPYFAALSFLKAGGGLSFLAAPQSVAAHIAAKGSEIILRPQPAAALGSLALSALEALLELAESVDFVVMGPGLSLDNETQQLVRKLAIAIEKPLLIDGDGLSAVHPILDQMSCRTQPTIFTPHIGEMARLTGLSVNEVGASAIDVVQESAEKWGATLVLKGAHSLIGMPDRRVFINLSGNSGMATAGSGDVLTGTIAAMQGLGFGIEEAVRMGVFVHGFAGDLAAKDIGEDGLTADDILRYLPGAMKKLRNNYQQVREQYGGLITVV